MTETVSNSIPGLDDSKYLEYKKLFSSFLYDKDIDGVGSILFCMKEFKP